MLRISDFAEIAQVSTSALRYYDEIGIFKPIYVDTATGYRYYTVDQLVRLNRILALRDLGIDLTQIAQLLDEDLSAEAFHGMLRLRQVQLQQSIQTAQEQLARIDARLSFIEQGDKPMLPEVVMKSVKATTVASNLTRVDGFMANAEYAHNFVAMLHRHRVKPDGYTQFVYHRHPSNIKGYDIEIAVPIDPPSAEKLSKTGADSVTVRQLPEVARIACAVYRGTPYSIAEAYQAIGGWIEQQHYTITGACRKVCLQWEGNLDDYLTEIQFPVEVQSMSDLF
ncbi:MAG TPA: MerR family transcriptional regulator [Phototrophicaceae bacterium]|jgi:DNA-binding transcriptional MerR regulator|nr:MerR family transcriptional regulator [Phototrophicaceae bacterium]